MPRALAISAAACLGIAAATIASSPVVSGQGTPSAPTPPPAEPAAPEGTQPATQRAEDDLAQRLNGQWALVLSADRAQAVIDRAAEQATSGLAPIVSGMTARELRQRNPLNRTVSIEIRSDRIVTRYASGVVVDSAPGQPTTIEAPGDRARTQVVQLVRDGRLEQVFTTDRGRRWTTFTPSPDGTRMTMESIARSERLSSDFRYQLEYQKRP